VPGCSVKIGDDGEVMLKGGTVFEGYWHNEDATREAFDSDGWFRTGDLGALDDDGYLSITGRKKDLIVTAGGKNVAPAVLEDRLRAHWLVGQCVVVGDRRPYVGALITVDSEVFPQWKRDRGLEDSATLETVREHPALLAELQKAVDDANRAVSRAEAIRRFRVLLDEFTIEGGQLTTTLKVKRQRVVEQYAGEIDLLYAQEKARTP
jgi:long-chain acyl-CoA synthetase